MKTQSKSWQIAAAVLLALGVHMAAGQEAKPQPAPTNPPPSAPAAATQTNPAPAQAVTNAQQRNIRFQFDGIPYNDVLERFSQMAGKPLVSDTNIQGTLTFNDPQAYNYQEALDTLNVMLSMKGVMLMEDGNFLRLAPFKEVPKLPLKILRGLDTTGDVRPGEVVTVVLQLRNLDAREVGEAIVSMLSNAGSVAPLSRGKGLIVTDKLSNIQRIRTLLAAIDTESVADRQMRAYTLLHASGAVVSDLINRTFGVATAPKRTQFNSQSKQLDVLPPDPSDYITAVYDDASRTLVLFGPRERIGLAEELISKFEDKEGGGGEVRIYYPQVTKADELAQMIRQAIPGIANPGDTASAAATKARVISDAAQNRLIVAAPVAGQVDQIEQLINRLDKPVHGSGTTFAATKSQTVQITKVFRPRSSEAASVAKILSEALSKRLPSGQTVATAQVTLEPNSQSVVVTGSPGDVQTAMDIVSQLETGSTSPRAQQTRFIDVGTVSEAKRIVPLVEQIYRSQVTDSISGQTAHAKIIADAESGRLIVTASDDHLARIEEIVKQFKSQKVQGQPRRLQILPLKNIRADAALASANSLITERMADKRFEDLTKPLLLPDASNNRLLVTATDEQFKEIQEVINLFDVTPEKSKREMLILPVQSKSATELINLTSQLLTQIGETQTDAQLAPKLIADPSGKQIIVLASARDVERITNLVQQLDSASATVTSRQFKGIELFSRKAAELTPLVQQLYQEQLKGQADPAGGPATMLAEDKNNRIMVSGAESEITRVEAIIRQLDPQGAKPGKDETRVIRLKSAVAADLATLIEKTVNAQSQHVKVLIDARSNSLVISGDPTGVEAASQVISQLDTRSDVQPRELRVLELKQGDANTVAPMVTTLFADMVKEQRGPEYVPQTKIVPDAAGNRLIVSGPKDELATVASVVEKVDQAPEGAGGARVFKLTMADATTLAPVVSNAMLRFDARNQAIRRVSVSADRESNSIIVSGSRTDLQDAQSIIERLDGEGVDKGRELKIIEVKTDEPEALANASMRVFTAQNAGRNVTSLVNITPDTSGKRLIVLAPASLLSQVETVISTLDSTRSPKEAKIYDFGKLAEAQRVLPVIQQLYRDQAGSNGGAHMVSDGKTGRIIVSARQDEFKQIDEIVTRLLSAAVTNQPARETRTVDAGTPSDVQRLLPIVQQLYQDQWKDKSETDPADAQIVADPKTGRLIITGKPDHIKQIEAILKQLNDGKPKTEARDTRVYDLTTANAMELATTVRTLYQEQAKNRLGAGTADTLILPDASANRLIVVGETNELDQVDDIIKKLDKVSAQSASTRVFKLKSADPDKVMEILSTALVRFDAYGRQQKRVSVVVDAKTRTLIATGDPKELQGVSVIIEQIDSIGALPERKMKVIPVKNARVADLTGKVRQLYQDQVKSQPELGLADALIMDDTDSNQIITAGSDAQINLIEQILGQLQDPTETQTPRETRVYDLNTTSAGELATTVRTLYDEQLKSRPLAVANRAVVLPDVAANRLVVSGISNELAAIDEIVKQLDKVDAQTGRTRVFKLKTAEAEQVASVLSAGLAQVNQFGRNVPRITVGTDKQNNLLIVSGEPKDLQAASVIVEQMDAILAKEPRQLRIVALKSGVASQLAEKVKSLYQDQMKGQPKSGTADALIIGEDASNRLIITAGESHLKTIEDIVSQLQQAGETSARELRVVTLQRNSAASVATMISQLFARQLSSQDPGERLIVTPSGDDRTLVLEAATPTLEKVGALVKTLDGDQALGKVEVRSYHLPEGNASDLAPTLARLFAERAGPSAAGNAPKFEADNGANVLIVAATAEQFTRIDKLIEELKRTAQVASEIRTFKLQHSEPAQIASVLETMLAEDEPGGDGQNRRRMRYRPGIGMEPAPHPKSVRVAPAATLNAVVVQGPPEKLTLAEKLIQTLDKQDTDGRSVIQSVHLKKASAENLAAAVNQNIANRGPQSSVQRVTVTPVIGPNSLLINGPAEAVQEVMKIIRELDQESEDDDIKVHIYKLENGNAKQVSAVVEQLLRNVTQEQNRTRSSERMMMASVAVDERANALVISGTPTHFKLVEQLLSTLDKAPERGEKDVQFVWLRNAKAFDVALKLEAVFESKPEAERPFIEADTFNNSITIIGRRADIAQIQELVARFDESTKDTSLQVRLRTLDRISAEQMARMLQNIYPQMAAGRLRIVEKLQPATNSPPSTNQVSSSVDAEVVVAVDKDANALLLSGPTQHLDEIDRIITELSYSYISTDAEFRVFSLKEADPVIVARTLSELFKVEQVKVEQQQQAQRPGEVRTITPTPKVTIVAEPRTRSVIVRAKPTDFALLETLIKQLDIAGVSSQLEFRLVALTNAPPEKVAPLVQQMVTQLNVIRPGEPLTVMADPRTRGLLVVARDSVLTQVERMIHSLDVPAPFAEAEVLVLSLKKASAPQLSAVLQSMLKPGTSGELTTEARDLQEQVRRLKIQNGDGKTVLLDLTKPIKILGDPLAGGQGGGNRLIISSTPDNLKALASVVEMMDSAPLAEGVMEVKLFRLKHASATRLTPMLQSVFAEAAFRDTAPTNQPTAAASQDTNGVRFERPVLRVERPALIVQGDDTANIIIVAARRDTIPLIETIVNQLDIPSASGMDTIRVYPLNHTDPVTLQKVILDVYSGPRASQLRTEDKPNVSIDERTQSLIVCGNSKAFGIIDSLIMQLDRELPIEMRDVRILMLQHADAPDVAASIQRLLDARVTQKSSLSKQQADSMRALVIGEPRSNSLLISGSKDSYELIETLAKQLDLAPTALSGKIRLVALEYADARFVSTALANLFNQRYQAAKAPEVQRNRPIIVPDPRSNSLLIAAGIDDNLVIDELLGKLDKKLEDPALSLTILPLRHNDAAKVAITFENIFAARLKARTAPGQEPSPQDQVKIETDSLNNALIVSASKDNLETLKGLLEKMDIEPVAADGVVQTFTLQFADAQRVATMLRTLVQQGLYRPGLTVPAGQGANSRREAMAIAVDPRSNTLIVSASPENLLVIREVLKQVDSKDLAENDNIRLYTLKHARASNLANVLQQFLRAKRQGEAGAVNAPERAISAAVIPDDRVNTLLVTGTKENFDVIDRIIQQLDGEDAMSQMNFKVFPLKQATASKLQDTMQKLFVNRPPRVKGEPVDPITVVADAWVNALIVGAAVDDMTMVSALIERLDSDQAQLGLTVQVFPLAKADARRVAQTVQGLYREGTPGITLPVVVSPDERLNALVVSAGEGDLKRIGELVKKLDTDQVARVSEIRVFPLQYARAESLSTILNTALNTKPSALNDQNPNSASLLQFITRTEGGKELVASALKEAVLITPDSRMNSLIVSAPVDYMDLLDQIIGRLDSGTPQSAKIKVFQLVNADARQMSELLMTLFRLQPSTQQNSPQRSIQYTLVKNSTGPLPFSTNGTNGASGAPGNGNGNGETDDPEVELASATIGTAEAGALSVTIDPRTNSLLIGGTDHYVNLVAQVIQALDSSAGQERKSQVYRLKHAQATEVQTAVSNFLDQERRRVQQILGQDAVGTALRMLEREVAVVAEPVSNTLLISANPRYFQEVMQIVEQLDQAQPQVLIQVLLAEVSLDATRSLGIEWDFQRMINAAAVGAGTSFGVPLPTPSLNTRIDRSLAVPPIPFPSADGFSATVTGDDYGFLIRALENDGRLEVLSRPQILTADNKPAEINVGQQVPFITDTRVTDQNAVISGVQYRTVGVSLRVTPRIGADGSVSMEISTTNSALTTSSIQITPTQAAPIINERRATTSVSVQSGQSILLAGLISTTDDTRSKKVPFLGDIPWFGMLFRSRSKLSDRKELLILLTPQVLLNAGHIAKLSDPSEVTREQLNRSQIRDQFNRDELQRQLLEPLFPDLEQKEPPKSEDKPKQEPKPQADPNSSPL